MEKQLRHLSQLGILVPNETVVWDHTDGCAAQYRSALSLFLLAKLATQFGVMIDRMIGAHAHGKGAVDGHNAVSKNVC